MPCRPESRSRLPGVDGTARFHRRGRKLTMATGNGAPDSVPANFTRPTVKRTSEALAAQQCHHSVSTRAGTNHTTKAPRSRANSYPFFKR